MALVSPGVEVSIVDESNYIPAATNSVPFILLATAQNKVSGAGTGVAAGTTAANAGKVYLITSQRDLAATFGNPFFYKTSNGTPINGYELNEYGLLAAYSVLGISNRAYIIRADVDLAALTATLTRPTGEPNNGDWWFDTSTSRYGIFEWSATTSAFTNKVPTVITSTDDIDTGTIPKTSIGSIGDYAVTATNANNPTYFKRGGVSTNTAIGDYGPSSLTDLYNTWVLIGSDDWKTAWPTVQGSATSPTITAGHTFYINDTLVTATGTTLNSLVDDINNTAQPTGVTAAKVANKFVLYADSTATNDGSTGSGGIITIDAGSGTILTALGISTGEYYAPGFQASPHTTVPRWRSSDTAPHPTGSVWHKTTAVNLGTNLVVKQYNSVTGVFDTLTCPLYENDQTALKNLDPAGGGKNIAAGTLYSQYDVSENDTFTFKIFERQATGATIIIGDDTAPTFVSGETFTIQASAANSTTLTTAVTATMAGTTAADFVSAFTAANVANTTATVLASGAIQISHTLGGVIVLKDTSGTPVADAGINTGVDGVRAGNDSNLILSNWINLGGTNGYTASGTAPSQDPANGTPWYYSATNVADIMINDGSGWKGYLNVTNDVRGFNLSNTDPAGPQFSATAPTTQSDTTALVYGDLWIDTSDLENYPRIYRWESVDSVDQWVLIDNADQTTENGILFADARWGSAGTIDPITGDLPTIVSLLSSNYLDIDAPDYTLYPTGTLLFNTRRSGFNVKEFRVNYFNAADFPDSTLPTVKDAWVTISGNKNDGSPYMGRKAVREIVVAAMKSAIDSSTDIREEQRQFNLLAAPGYPELIPNMIALNNDRNNTGFVIGDTPLRLAANGTDVTSWVTNTGGDVIDSEAGLVSDDPYFGVFYPSCQTTDLSGSAVVTYPSHMMLRTFVRNDEVAFPWLAPAGSRRGTVDNASSLGYVDAATGEFVTTAVSQGLRDTLYQNDINPITFIPGTGITNYGNKTKYSVSSALDRINVSRLVAFIRGRLEEIANSYLFEPNDKITRDEIKNAVEGLMNDLVAKRGIYDYLVVCDDSNNTPARIDRNELYVDIAIEPVKAVEFIYIPVRIKNTGEIAAGNVASAQTV